MPDAREQLDRQYHEMRWRILSLAADLDRLQRLPGGQDVLANDARIERLRRCVDTVLAPQADRAERVQMILSDRSADPRKAASESPR